VRKTGRPTENNEAVIGELGVLAARNVHLTGSIIRKKQQAAGKDPVYLMLA
jgi:hypothetical protein